MTKKIKSVLLLVICMGIHIVYAQEPKAKGGIFLLKDATIETVTNGTVTGSILVQDGKIAAIGDDLVYPDAAEVIDCKGMTIYPGLIDGGTTMGLREVGSIPLTLDDTELGDITPQMKAITAVNPSSTHIAINRMGGITTALSVPGRGIFPGQAALIHLYGYTPQAMFAGFEAVVMAFPSAARRGRRDSRSEDEIEEDRKKSLKRINEVWIQVEEYARIDSLHEATGSPAPEYYPEMMALLPVVKEGAPVLIEVNRAEDILSAIEWVTEKDVNAIFTGCSEGWRVATQLAESGIPVITGSVLNLPTRESDRYDSQYRNPGIMQQAGVVVAIRSDDRQSQNARNLPFHAGFAAAYGMGKEEALRAITIVPATIFGLEDQLGSIEVGKVADLVITDGDIFEPSTQIHHVFISGWQMPYSSRQQRLYEEFLERN